MTGEVQRRRASARRATVTLRRFGALIACAAVVAACSGSGSPDGSSPPSNGETTPASQTARPSGGVTTSAGPTTLPLGKTNLALAAGRYGSPAGFTPPLQFTLPAGWTSVHRYADGFDLARSSTSGPDVIVAILRPAQSTALEALTAVLDRANGTIDVSSARIGDTTVEAEAITGGSGQLAASADGGIALDAASGQLVRAQARDFPGGPVLIIVVVPDATTWDAVMPSVADLLASITSD